jgi:hypothetical protein
MRDQSCTDGIQQHIAQDHEEMSILLDREALKSGLPDMARSTVAAAVLLNMTGQPPMHESAEGAHARWLEDDVKMIGEQAKAKQLHWMTGFRRCEQIEEA